MLILAAAVVDTGQGFARLNGLAAIGRRLFS
jgi:hypothetical protein